MAARGEKLGAERNGEGGQEVKLLVIKQISYGDVMYRMVTIVNNIVLHI